MPDRIPSVEARQALFCANVVAIAAGEVELTNRRIAAAVLSTTEVQVVCHAVGISAGAVLRSIEGDRESTSSELLESVARSLAATGVQFGSRPHLDSIRPLRMAERTQRALIDRTEAVEATGRGFNSVDVLLAVLESDTAIAAELARHGLTTEVLRAEAG